MIISVTPQEMLEILIRSGVDTATSKSIILDLLLASEGGLKVPQTEVEEINEIVEPYFSEVDEVAAKSKRKTKRVNFSAFGGSAENLK
jgi:hypothetical protein